MSDILAMIKFRNVLQLHRFGVRGQLTFWTITELQTLLFSVFQSSKRCWSNRGFYKIPYIMGSFRYNGLGFSHPYTL